jgi:hypothetical protein
VNAADRQHAERLTAAGAKLLNVFYVRKPVIKKPPGRRHTHKEVKAIVVQFLKIGLWPEDLSSDMQRYLYNRYIKGEDSDLALQWLQETTDEP